MLEKELVIGHETQARDLKQAECNTGAQSKAMKL